MNLLKKIAKLRYYHEKVDDFRNNNIIRKIKSNISGFRSKANGEELPSEINSKTNPSTIKEKFKHYSIPTAIIYVLLLFFCNLMSWLQAQAQAQANGNRLVKFQNGKIVNGINYNVAFLNGMNPFKNRLPFTMWVILLILAIIAAIVVCKRIGYADKQIAYGQKGDSRLTTIKELKEQFKEIPDHDSPSDYKRGYSFKGYGGVPISHFKTSYFVEDGAYNCIIVGQSRAGKGEMIVIPKIDIISRAEKQSSMIVNDPKKELYTASSDTLRKRGYEVYLLNLVDASNSMSYDPMALIKKAWGQGDKETAIQLVNSWTHDLYNQTDHGQNQWVYDGAQSAASAMIISLIKYCSNPSNFEDHKSHPEKVISNNILDMAIEVGGTKYLKNPMNPGSEVNLLDQYFNSLDQTDDEKTLYAPANLMSTKEKGSIFSSLTQGLMPFQFPKISRMTSKNSINLKDLGFPKWFSFKTFKELEGQIVHVQFRKHKTKDNPHCKLIKDYEIRVGTQGFVEYNFDCDLHEGDLMQIVYKNPREHGEKYRALYRIHFPKGTLEDPIPKDDRKHLLKLIELVNELDMSRIKLSYCTKPIAIFLNISDSDRSNDAIASTFFTQVYQELATQCQKVKGNKCLRRVEFLLDEFDSAPKIADMDHKMTISAGRNILFTIILQSYEQLMGKYGSSVGKTIKENGQVKILIKTDSASTNREFSDATGKYTHEDGSVHRDAMNIASGYNTHAEALSVVPATRLSQMLSGEALVLRPLHRWDLKGKIVRPYPIFNHEKTRMPFAHTFLNDEFKPTKDPNTLRIDNIHRDVDLNSLKIDWTRFLAGHVSDRGIEAYISKGQDDEEEEDNNESESASNSSKTENKEPSQEDAKKELARQREANSKFVQTLRLMRNNHAFGKDLYKIFLDLWRQGDTDQFKAKISNLDGEEGDILLNLWNKEIAK
ncbi:VirD4-like conjugal transfer protein, CD1115 family [Lactobacillus taiwanensis]|uniref:VirD4-like conjugal transfer protein, CD1115 family n=1 Tax=Lactobacillus taiwanensis TaxID=508451 RepID=UPI00241C9D44|nr:type IV secretory system conjugative DNA transfer family protein [Lactobacillus taiwanensis]